MWGYVVTADGDVDAADGVADGNTCGDNCSDQFVPLVCQLPTSAYHIYHRLYNKLVVVCVFSGPPAKMWPSTAKSVQGSSLPILVGCSGGTWPVRGNWTRPYVSIVWPYITREVTRALADWRAHLLCLLRAIGSRREDGCFCAVI